MTPLIPEARHLSASPLASVVDEDADIQDFDDQELERALKAVSWNALDLTQFLRSCRCE